MDITVNFFNNKSFTFTLWHCSSLNQPTLHPGLLVVEPPGGHAGERGPEWGSGGGLHTSPGAAARLYQVPLQPGHQLYKPGGTQVCDRWGGGQSSHTYLLQNWYWFDRECPNCLPHLNLNLKAKTNLIFPSPTYLEAKPLFPHCYVTAKDICWK